MTGLCMSFVEPVAKLSGRRLVANLLAWAALVCLLAVLGGCAGMSSVTSQVSSYGAWPEGRKPGAYVFERLPSQQSQPTLQSQLESAAQPALASLGFVLAPEAQSADTTVQVAAQVHVMSQPRYDPFWAPYGPYWPHGAYGPPGSAAWSGWWGAGGGGGLAFSMSMAPPYVQMQVSVLIRDRRSNQVLYETHARHERVGVADDRLYPYLFEAALKDFAQQAVSPRAVTVTIEPDNH